jgi:putative MATE family efflux protein
MEPEQNLTVGHVPTQLIKFAIPLFFANLLQSLYNIVDMLVVGRIVGSTGVAAISNASTLVFIINAVCTGVMLGGTVLIAQYKGANDSKSQRETVGTIYTIAAIVAIVITTIGLLICKPLLNLMNVPSEAMQYAYDYMQIIFIGTFFVFGYNATCSVLRGLGDSIRPLFFVGIATVINIVLDCLFVGPMEMGTAGAAYATIIAQGVSFLISIVYLKRQRFIFDFKLKSFAIKKDKLLAVFKISLPTTIQMTVVNLSYAALATMLNGYGATIAAAAGIGLKINTFAATPCWAVGQSITTMVGQNMGAGLTDRAEKIGKAGVRLTLLATFVTVVIVQIFAKQLVALFAPSSPEVITAGVEYLKICCFINAVFYAVMYCFNSFAVGVGSANIAMVNALLDTVFIRFPLCWSLSTFVFHGVEGVFWGQALSSIIPALIGAAYFYRRHWKKKKLIEPTA